MFIHVSLLCGYSVHPQFLLGGGKGVEPPTKFSKRGVGVGGLAQPQLWEEGSRKRWGCDFTKKVK